MLTVFRRAGLLSVLPHDGLPVTVHGSAVGQLLEGGAPSPTSGSKRNGTRPSGSLCVVSHSLQSHC